MVAIPLVRASKLFPIIDFLNQIGSPTERLLSQVNLSASCMHDPENLLPFYQSSLFLENAASLEGIETLGLLIGQQTAIPSLGALGRILGNCFTLFDLLITLEQIVPMANSGDQCRLRWEKDWVWLQHHCMSLPNITNLQTKRYAMMLYLNALRLALGSTWRPAEIYLEGPPCRALLAMDEFSEVHIHFLSPYNAIKIPRAALILPINPAADHYGLVLQPDYEAFHQSAPAADLIGSLRQLIQTLLPQGCPDITLVAQASSLSGRSLQRQLAEAGLSYSQLVDKVRFELAVKLLLQPEVKLIDIAAELGYTDAANFTRAFKRWTGHAPRQFRMVQLG